MSENKFIKRLKGEQTAKSVLEIKNQSVNTSFANMPQGTSDANRVYTDHSGDAIGVLQGAENWKLNGSTLVYASSINSDGNDYTGETDKTGGSVVLDGNGMAVSGAGLWVNATYTFTGDPTKTVAIFNAGTKWVLKLCGHSLFSDNKTIDLTVLIKIGASSVISKVFTVTTDSFNFCKDLVIDFTESAQTITKVQGNETLKLQVLCSDTTASATLYNGMTVLTSLQRRIDADVVSSDKYNLDDVLDDKANIDLDNLSTAGKANISALGTYNESNTYNAGTVGKALQGKLNLDGTSIMTGPLKMRAGSMQGAVAAYWDGVGFFKLNSNDSVTLLASMEATDGLCPATNNTYNIGKTNYKWKDAYIARVITAVLNNGYDIAVPVTNGPDTLALKSEVDTAANSGRMITDTGVWFAKMYAASTVPTGAEYNGTNYADFSQVDSDNNPIIVIYEYQSGSWVETERVTPPANYDGYVPVTKKMWDIVEQTGQQGGRVLWNHQSKEFTPYPNIVDLSNVATTDLDNLTPIGEAKFTAKANTDMDNLTSTGKENVSKQGTYDSGETYTAGTVGAELAKIADKADKATTLAGYGITDGANTALSNLTNAGKEVCANMAMPSDRSVTLTAGASGASYLMPADGYLFAVCGGSIKIQTNIGIAITTPGTTLGGGCAVVPVKKGDTVIVEYSTSQYLGIVFYYANGAQ